MDSVCVCVRLMMALPMDATPQHATPHLALLVCNRDVPMQLILLPRSAFLFLEYTIWL